MNSIEALWSKKDLIIADGAMATELERRGLDLNDSLWSARALAENPDSIRAVHRDYLEAGPCRAFWPGAIRRARRRG